MAAMRELDRARGSIRPSPMLPSGSNPARASIVAAIGKPEAPPTDFEGPPGATASGSLGHDPGPLEPWDTSNAFPGSAPAPRLNAYDAAVEEAKNQLNKLFEEQLRKQYDTMKREANKLAKRHQRDVANLDERFKHKMAGLGQRFKQLEVEEAQNEQVKQENKDMQETVERLEGVVEEQERRQQAALATIEEKQAQVQQLTQQVGTMATQEAQRASELEGMVRRKETAEQRMKDVVLALQQQLEERSGDLQQMQARLQAVKASYHEESVRKAGEVEELGASLEPLLSSNKMMGGLVGQVKEQVARREADMRTQLALLKNCIAFALYVDETLLVDMSDPKTFELMSDPRVAYPSGVSYSKASIDALHSEAGKAGRRAVCPQSGMGIEATVPNLMLDQILGRFLFKQQVTDDVIKSLREFQRGEARRVAAPEGEEPVEVYVQRMKATMMERMEGLHKAQQRKIELGYEEQLEWRREAVGKQDV